MEKLDFPNIDLKISNYINEVNDKAEKLIKDDIPNYMEEMNELLKDNRFNLENLERIYTDTGIPVPFVSNGETVTNKRKRTNSETADLDNSGFKVETLKGGVKVLALPSGQVSINKHIKELIELLKPKIRKLIENVTLLRMWIIFLIPKIEDGNNFGVEIQEDILEEIRSIESEATLYFEHFSRYYLSRAKAVAKVAKYPHIADFRQALKELDERQMLEIKLTVSEIRNHYASIYDFFCKNYLKVKKPKSYNQSIMF